MYRFIFWTLILFASAPDPACADKRVALVIGNSAYKHWGKLDTTGNDAADMAATLKGLGFKVIEGTVDLDKASMDHKIRDFSEALTGAEAGVFFYAGHAFQLNGTNYLVPVDARLENERSVDFEAVRLDLIQRTMEQATKTNVLFLDACRDNPFVRNLATAYGTRSRSGAVPKGLAAAEAGKGTLISYSTQPGNVADDSVELPDKTMSRNSPFTGALVKRIAASGDDLLSILTDVRNEVMSLTEERQVPWEHTSLRRKFRFIETPAAVEAPTTPLVSEAQRRWSLIQNSDDLAALEAFRQQYGATDPLYDQLAARRIEALRRRLANLETPSPDGQKLPAVPGAVCTGVEALVGQEKRCLKPGDSFKDCEICPEMVVVPAGRFKMGSPAAEDHRYDHEGPQHNVTISKPFAVGKFELTFAEWDACLTDGGCKYKPLDERQRPTGQDWDRDKRPVVLVSWNDLTKEYLPWLSKLTGKTYRLLSEAEWEYAARAGTTTPFSTGATITSSDANIDGTRTYGGSALGISRGSTVDVGSFKPNAFGIYDMHGNVYEWVEDCYSDNYDGAPTDGSARAGASCSRIVRGGSWMYGDEGNRSAYRLRLRPVHRDYIEGGRIARTLN